MKEFLIRLNQLIHSRARQGKSFEASTRASLKRLSDNPDNNFWFQRLYDFRSFQYLAKKFNMNANVGAIKQPGDFIACKDGHLYVIECKSSQANRFNLENVRPSQEEAMIELSKAKAGYWLLILRRGESRTEQTLYALTAQQWLNLIKQEHEFKSLTWGEIKGASTFTLKRVGKVWDLSPLFPDKWCN